MAQSPLKSISMICFDNIHSVFVISQQCNFLQLLPYLNIPNLYQTVYLIHSLGGKYKIYGFTIVVNNYIIQIDLFISDNKLRKHRDLENFR